MRGAVITKGSKFRDLLCQKCSQPLKVGQGAVTHTLFLEPSESSGSFVESEPPSLQGRPQSSARSFAVTRIVWHSACIQPIVAKAPLDDAVVQKLVASHREKILERMGGER